MHAPLSLKALSQNGTFQLETVLKKLIQILADDMRHEKKACEKFAKQSFGKICTILDGGEGRIKKFATALNAAYTLHCRLRALRKDLQ